MSNQIISWAPGVTLEAIEKEVILKAFQHYRFNKTTTANALGISIRTLDHKLAKYEDDAVQQRDREHNDRVKREEFLKRARGQVPTNEVGAPNSIYGTSTLLNPPSRVHMESLANVASEQLMPLSERKEVQSMLPTQTPASSPKKGRGGV